MNNLSVIADIVVIITIIVAVAIIIISIITIQKTRRKSYDDFLKRRELNQKWFDGKD